MEQQSCLKDSHNSSMDEQAKTSPLSINRKKVKKKDRKRKYCSSTAGSEEESPTKMLKSKHKKKCKKRHKHSKEKKSKPKDTSKHTENHKINEDKETIIGPEIPNELLQKAQSMAPMSKEEWEKRQSVIRRVYDKETGRTRLVRGDGEIIEEIVSRERHQEINRQATESDGNFFQSNIKKKI